MQRQADKEDRGRLLERLRKRRNRRFTEIKKIQTKGGAG